MYVIFSMVIDKKMSCLVGENNTTSNYNTKFHVLHTVVPVLLFSKINEQSERKKTNFVEGRTTLVQLFEWTWDTIAAECENFLGPKGFAGVQISPPNENIIKKDANFNRPWWERYQPVSYLLSTRSGNKDSLAEMIQRCNLVGVRIYADIVINHMAATGNVGTAGSSYNPKTKSYPKVPYEEKHFNHPPCLVNDYQNAFNVRNCELLYLKDLNQSQEYVQEQIVQYLNNLIDLGVAGFRIDAAKHMWPQDLNQIYSKIKNLNTSFGFPPNSRPFIYQEVIDLGGEAISKHEYTSLGRVLDFKFGLELGNAFQGENDLSYLKNWGPKWDLLESSDSVVFIDNHDNQREGSSAILTYKQAKLYKMATAFMLAHPHGIPRVMSSFGFQNKDEGPPQDTFGNLLSPQFNSDYTCTNNFICEHRWRQIYNMVAFRNEVGKSELNHWWFKGHNQIAFGRDDKGFIAIVLQESMNEWLPSKMPPGTYCDIISGQLSGKVCTGKTVTVSEQRLVHVILSEWEMDGVLAIHVGAKIVPELSIQHETQLFER